MIYDLTIDPTVPVLRSTFRTHGSIGKVWPIPGNRLLANDLGEGLIVFDVSTPTSPQRIGNYFSPGVLRNMAKSGDRLYVADQWNGFTILDVANPLSPSVLGKYQTPLTSIPDPNDPIGGGTITVNKGIDNWGIAVRNNLVYLAAGYGGIHIVNVTNPAVPVKVGAVPFPDIVRADAIELDGRVAHVCRRSSILEYVNFDVSDITAPIVLSELGSVSIGPLDRGYSIVTKLPDEISYVAVGGGVAMVNTSDPSLPTFAGFVDNPSDSLAGLDVALGGESLFVVNPHCSTSGVPDGFHVFDISSPLRPIEESIIDGCRLSAVAYQNGRAYVVGFFPTLSTMFPRLPTPPPAGIGWGCVVFDIADPGNPNAIAYAPLVATTKGNHLLADEPHIYLALGDNEPAGNNLRILKATGLPSSSAADLNHDGHVNGLELALLLAAWGRCPAKSTCTADLNHDGIVNGTDLAMLLGSWG